MALAAWHASRIICDSNVRQGLTTACRRDFLTDARCCNVGSAIASAFSQVSRSLTPFIARLFRSVIAAAAPTFVAHAQSDELVPVDDCREYCARNAVSAGGFVCRYLELPPQDSQGARIDHSLFHWAKPDALGDQNMEKVMKDWFLLP
jgi:hypothetical protein